MRWTSTMAMAGLAELAAHFLSLTWGFMVLLGGFCFVASLLRVTAAKVSGTEARLNGHIAATAPAVNLVNNGGTIGGSVQVNGDHNVSGNLTGYNTNATHGMTTPAMQVNGNANVTGTHTAYNSNATNGMTTPALAVNGDANVGGTHTAYNSNATNGMTTPRLNLSGGTTMPNGSPGAVGSPPSGTGGAAAYAGNFYPGTGAYNWAVGVTNAINQIHSILSADGITN